MADSQAEGPSKKALMSVVEEMLANLFRERSPEAKRPTKDDLLAYLKSGSRKLNLYFLRHLSAGEITSLRKDPVYQEKLFSALRNLIISLHQPLLNPQRVKSLIREASTYPTSEAHKDPELWAARLLKSMPVKLDIHLPLVDLRYLIALMQRSFEARIHEAINLEELDSTYVYIERELALTPRIEIYLKRSLELAGRINDPGELSAYYRLLSLRIPETLTKLPPSAEKDKTLLEIKELTGLQDPVALRLMFKKNAMKKADELMKNAKGYNDLFELRFFFSQIGERSNKKLLSKKTGELARKVNIRSQGYQLMAKLDTGELDEDGLLELVPAIIAKAEVFVQGAPLRYLELLIGFYLETVYPLLRSLKSEPEKVPRLMQNFKRQVGLLNVYRDLDHLAQVMQRKMVLAICGPQMLAKAPEKIMSCLTRLPPEFYPPKVMQALRGMIREKGTGYRFTTADVLRIFAAYPPPEGEEEEEK
ncbi:MAG TPA: hypothetical protein VM123_00370 [archaeon]|nr:hypothetical protein [archaeon]